MREEKEREGGREGGREGRERGREGGRKGGRKGGRVGRVYQQYLHGEVSGLGMGPICRD